MPQPEAPTTAVKEPGARSRSTPASATTRSCRPGTGKERVRARTLTLTAPLAALAAPAVPGVGAPGAGAEPPGAGTVLLAGSPAGGVSAWDPA